MLSHPPCDYNAWLGPWPFRDLRDWDKPEVLLQSMIRNHIQQSYVSSLRSFFESDPYDGNVELFRRIQNHSELVLLPIVNPDCHHVGCAWQQLQQTTQKRCESFRYIPPYGEKSLFSENTRQFINEHSIKRVFITVRLRDKRQGWILPELSPQAAIDFAQRFPNLQVVINGMRMAEYTHYLQKQHFPRNVLLDNTFIDGVYSMDTLHREIQNHLVPGSGFPIHYQDACILNFGYRLADPSNA